MAKSLEVSIYRFVAVKCVFSVILRESEESLMFFVSHHADRSSEMFRFAQHDSERERSVY